MAKCKACGKEIVFLKTEAGKVIPINAETADKDDYAFDKSRHISHFSDCPAAKTFRKEKK